MIYSLHHVRDWSYEKLYLYNQQLTKAILQIAARFPDDILPDVLAKNIAAGQTDLWLILDEKEEFVAFLTTETEVAASGKKRFLLLELAGRGGVDSVALLPEIEAYAKSLGALEICAYGRLGWRRALAHFGYQIATVKYRKEI